MDFDVYQDFIYMIRSFQQETGISKRDFVVVVNPDCPMFDTRHFQTVAGVEVITHVKMHETAVGIVAREHLDELDEVIQDMGLDRPPEFNGHVLGPGVVEIEVEFLEEEKEAIEMVQCSGCGHPISVLNSTDLENVVCPWCNKINLIE